jgi:GNAT superfamily N-acetyltransferase
MENYIVCELTTEHLDETVRLLNSEWPRSFAERRRTLENSMVNATKTPRQLPISLCLLDKEQKNKIIGHSNIASISITPECSASGLSESSFYLRSLVIDKSCRGRGLGRLLLEQSEQYLKENFMAPNQSNYVCLNTKDKQKFYELNGYVEIEPVLFYTIENENSSDGFNSLRLNLFKSMNIKPSVNPTSNLNTWFKKHLTQ